MDGGCLLKVTASWRSAKGLSRRSRTAKGEMGYRGIMSLHHPCSLYKPKIPTIRVHIPLFKGTRRVLVGLIKRDNGKNMGTTI